MRRLCATYGDELRADLLVLPHHGRYHQGLEEFLDRVRPAVAIASGDAEGVGRRTVRALRQRGVPRWITGREGAIIITGDGGGVRLKGFASGRTGRAWRKERP